MWRTSGHYLQITDALKAAVERKELESAKGILFEGSRKQDDLAAIVRFNTRWTPEDAKRWKN